MLHDGNSGESVFVGYYAIGTAAPVWSIVKLMDGGSTESGVVIDDH